MKSLWQNQTQEELVERISKVNTGSVAQWGKMTPPRMVSHLVESLRMAIGQLEVAPRKGPLRFFPLKQFVIYLAPFPKGVPTAPELLAGDASNLEGSKSELTRLVGAFAARGRDAAWPNHPAFGPLSANAWGVLVYRHMDHHLRQFGA